MPERPGESYEASSLWSPEVITIRDYFHLTVFSLLGALTLCGSLWVSASILYFLSRDYTSGAVALLFFVIYLLFLYVMLRALRWWWLICVIYSFVSLWITLDKTIDGSPSLWIFVAAPMVAAIVLAIAERGREDNATEETFGGKLVIFLYAQTYAAMILAGLLFSVAFVFQVEWFLIEELEFVPCSPYIKIVFPEWILDD